MENMDSIKDLAKSSFLASSYKDSYKYSDLVIQSDPACREAWLYKGLSAAALMSKDESLTAEEVLFAIDRGFPTNASQEEIASTQDLISTCYVNIIKSLEKEHIEKVADHHKVPMPEGGSVLLHRVAQKGYGRVSAKALAPKRLSAIKILQKSYELESNKKSISILVEAIDGFFAHSMENMEYLNDENDIKLFLNDLRSKLVEDAKKIGLHVNSAKPDKSGCFIATAATGSYENSEVIQLRVFRDYYLKPYRAGQVFISTYYALSPPLASFIGKSSVRRVVVYRLFVLPLTRIIKIIF